jgi:hypothetical protein
MRIVQIAQYKRKNSQRHPQSRIFLDFFFGDVGVDFVCIYMGNGVGNGVASS